MLCRSFSRLILFFVLVGLRCSAGPLPPAGFLQDMPFHGRGPLFGGFSALHLSPDGRNLTAVSDRGAFVTGQIKRDAKGNILSIATDDVTPLLAREGKPFRKGRNDSEGLAIAPDGKTYVSFEGPARIMEYDRLGGAAKPLHVPNALADLPPNGSLESLAVDGAGTLYTLPEEPDGPTFPVYRYQNGHWDQPFSIQRRGEFLASDAAIGPDGRLYLLERAFYGLGGFASRLRRFDMTKAGLGPEQTLFETAPGTFDNLEGLSVWRDATGLRATMVSDDNFLFIFRSQIVEFRLPD